MLARNNLSLNAKNTLEHFKNKAPVHDKNAEDSDSSIKCKTHHTQHRAHSLFNLFLIFIAL